MIINNPISRSMAPQSGAAGGLPKFADDTAHPFPGLQPQLGVGAVRGLSKTASQTIAGARPRPNQVQADVVSKARMLDHNFELATERVTPDYATSGSDHDPSSVSLFAMVHEFMENEGAGNQAGCLSDGHGFLTSSSKDSSNANGEEDMTRTIQSLAMCVDSTEEALLRDTQLVLNSITAEVQHVCDDGKPATVTHSCLKRRVMVGLQEMGYIAAICKTKWDHLCGVPPGDYEYIDVLIKTSAPSKQSERLFVDIEFQAQFEIARPTNEFTAIRQFLPPIYVGRSERLKQIVCKMSEATKQSLRATGLHLPPWRKPAYMKAKWFSSYKRTSNVSSSRPCREMGHLANGLGLAMRGGGLDAKYTNSFEMLYHDAGSNFLSDGKGVALCRRGRDEITVVGTDWQPPTVAPRLTVPRKQGAIAGLASMLTHASES
eukprot:c21558_g1_i1 orf=106-1401(+)